MAYMNRLGIWGPKTPFREFGDFIQAVERRYVYFLWPLRLYFSPQMKRQNARNLSVQIRLPVCVLSVALSQRCWRHGDRGNGHEAEGDVHRKAAEFHRRDFQNRRGSPLSKIRPHVQQVGAAGERKKLILRAHGPVDVARAWN